MKVLLVQNYSPDQQWSMLGYGQALHEGLEGLGLGVESTAPTKRIGGGIASGSRSKWLGYLDKFIFFHPELRRRARSADLVHVVDHSNSLYIGAIRGRPNLITCHDLLAVRASLGEIPGWSVGKLNTAFQKLVLRGLDQFNFVVADSQTTKLDLLRLTKIGEDKIEVIPAAMLDLAGVRHSEQERQDFNALGIVDPFFMHIGNNSHYKNRAGVVAIYKELAPLFGGVSPKLLMAGKSIPPELKQKLPLDTIIVENPTNSQVKALYAGAEALIFPSLFEGFGLPIIEAQALGCPVFTTNKGPMTEVGGDAAVYFDPSSPKEAAEIIFQNWSQRHKMRELGLKNIKRFDRSLVLDSFKKFYARVAT